MAFLTGPAWAFKDVITSARLAQMVENLLKHDHRADGSQGDPIGHLFVPAWLAADVACGAGAATAVGSILIPELKRPATLFLHVKAQQNAATAGAAVLTPDAGDPRLTVPALLRWATAPVTTIQGHTWALPLAAGAAATTAFTLNPTVALSAGRVYAWVQG